MEFFGFASGNSNTGPFFPFLAESVLKSYPQDLMDHPAVPGLPDTTVTVYETVSSVDLTSFAKGLADASTSFLQKPLARHIGIGLLATAFAYSVWKISLGWNENIDLESSSEINFDFEVQKLPTFGNAEIQAKTVPLYLKDSKCESFNAGDGGNISAVGGDGPPKVAERGKCNPETKKAKLDKMKSGKPKSDIPATKVDKKNSPESETAVEESKVNFQSYEEFQSQLVEALSRLDEVRLRLEELESEKNILGAEVDLRKRVIQKLQDENTSERDKRQQAELKMEIMEIENVQLRQLRKEVALKSGQIERLERFLREREELQEKLFQDYVVLPKNVAETRMKDFEALQARINRQESDVGSKESPRGDEVICQVSRSSSELKLDKQTCPSDHDVSVVPSPSNPNCNSEKVNKVHRSKPKENIHKSLPNLGNANEIDEIMDEDRYVAVEAQSKIGTVTSGSDNATSVTEYFTEKSESHKGVFAQFKALINGFNESSSESDIGNESDVPRILKGLVTGSDDKANNNLSDGQSSVFMSASSGPGSSEEEEEVGSRISDKATSKAFKSRSPKRLTRHERDMTREKDKVSKSTPKTSLSNGDKGSKSVLENPMNSVGVSDLEHKYDCKSTPHDCDCQSRSRNSENETHVNQEKENPLSSRRGKGSNSILETASSTVGISDPGRNQYSRNILLDFQSRVRNNVKDTNGSREKENSIRSQCQSKNNATDLKDSHEAQSSSAGSAGENDADSEDSWIVIMPAVG